jgi:hypothetical protein
MKISDIDREHLQRTYADRWITKASEYDLVDLAWEALMEKLDKMTNKEFVAFIEKYDPEALSILQQK